MGSTKKWFSLLLIVHSTISFSQQKNINTSNEYDLEQCIQYANQNSPLLKQSQLDQAITDHTIKSKLADWYPQIRFDYNLQHTFQLQVSSNNGNIVPIGTKNNSYGQFGLTQNIFSSDAFLAISSANTVRKQALQNTIANKINLTVNVAKSYYDVLLTLEQIKVFDENIVRLKQSLNDAYNQYKGGIVDNVDYKRATIALNNTQAERKAVAENLKAKYAYLKMTMGFPDSANLSLKTDQTNLENIALADTTDQLTIENRIEYQQLLTQKHLQELNYNYYKWQFIPTIKAFGNYNLNYMNNNIDNLYQNEYPNSYIGVSVGVPLFQGFKRIQNMKQAALQSQRVNYDLDQIKLEINTEVARSFANYKAYLIDYYTMKDNVDLAKEVFNTIELQYKAGIKTYLEVVTAQTDLRTSELNYANALYQLLASKFDLEKALGTVKIN